MRLDPRNITLIADAVAERLRTDGVAREGLLTAAQVAERYGVGRAWIYEHKDQLGAIALGDGPKPRWRFDPTKLAEAFGANRMGSAPPADVTSRPRSRRRTRSGAPLLPIGSPPRNDK
jgi:hypothetical protein